MKTPEEIAIQKEKRRIYMRNYKRKQYAEKREQMKETQRLYYHTNINKGINREQIQKFDIMPVEFTKALSNLNKIKGTCPEELRKFMSDYINTQLSHENNEPQEG